MTDMIDDPVVWKQTYDDEEWEIRAEYDRDGVPYAAHINCSHQYVRKDQYSGLWSWEVHDVMQDSMDQKENWCHYCRIPVPKGLQALVLLYHSGRGGTT